MIVDVDGDQKIQYVRLNVHMWPKSRSIVTVSFNVHCTIQAIILKRIILKANNFDSFTV